MSLESRKYKEKNRERYKEYKRRYRNKTGSGFYKKREWTLNEAILVLEHNVLDRELSKKMKRSVQSIQVMRSKLNVGKHKFCTILKEKGYLKN